MNLSERRETESEKRFCSGSTRRKTSIGSSEKNEEKVRKARKDSFLFSSAKP